MKNFNVFFNGGLLIFCWLFLIFIFIKDAGLQFYFGVVILVLVSILCWHQEKCVRFASFKNVLDALGMLELFPFEMFCKINYNVMRSWTFLWWDDFNFWFNLITSYWSFYIFCILWNLILVYYMYPGRFSNLLSYSFFSQIPWVCIFVISNYIAYFFISNCIYFNLYIFICQSY